MFRTAHATGKAAMMGVSCTERGRRLHDLGVRIFSIGTDGSVNCRAHANVIALLKAAFG